MTTSSSRSLVLASSSVALGFGLGWIVAKKCSAESSKSGEGFEMFEIPDSVTVHVVETLEALADMSSRVLQSIQDSSIVVAGLDTEWASGKKVALLQLAIDNTCLLIRTSKLGLQEHDVQSQLPASFLKLMLHPAMVFAGSGIQQDLSLIREQLGIDCARFVELQSVARKECLDAQNGVGLQGLTRTVLGLDLCKDNAIRCGNWDAASLSQAQLTYAAVDAMVGREILLKIFETSGSGRVAGTDLASWLAPLENQNGDAKQKAKKMVAETSAASEKVEGASKPKDKKAPQVLTLAETLEKACQVAAAFTQARHAYKYSLNDGAVQLLDPILMPGMQVKSSSSANGLAAQNCVVLDSTVMAGIRAETEHDWFLPSSDWRAERRAAVKYDGVEVASIKRGRSCHWLEVELPKTVHVSMFALRATASAACHTNGPTSWILQGVEESSSDSSWRLLHKAGLDVAVGDQQSSASGSSPLQVWDYDTKRYSNGQIPGDTRVFQVGDECTKVPMRRFRWTFFSDANAFSVNLSGVLLFGTVI